MYRDHSHVSYPSWCLFRTPIGQQLCCNPLRWHHSVVNPIIIFSTTRICSLWRTSSCIALLGSRISTWRRSSDPRMGCSVGPKGWESSAVPAERAAPIWSGGLGSTWSSGCQDRSCRVGRCWGARFMCWNGPWEGPLGTHLVRRVRPRTGLLHKVNQGDPSVWP